MGAVCFFGNMIFAFYKRNYILVGICLCCKSPRYCLLTSLLDVGISTLENFAVSFTAKNLVKNSSKLEIPLKLGSPAAEAVNVTVITDVF